MNIDGAEKGESISYLKIHLMMFNTEILLESLQFDTIICVMDVFAETARFH